MFSIDARYKELFRLCSDVMRAIVEIPQPVIAAVNGIATAAGCQLVAACDLAVASPESKFSTPGVEIGLFCSTPAVSLARAVGKKAAMDMLLTGRMVPAEEALRIGLISHVDDNPEDRALELAEQIASRSGRALAIGKQTFYEQIQMNNIADAYEVASQAMVDGMLSEDANIGINSFFEKRDPEWKNI